MTPSPNSFKQKYLDDEAEEKDLDFYIEQWHTFGFTTEENLGTFLGLSQEEYAMMVENCNGFFKKLEEEKSHYKDFLRAIDEESNHSEQTISREMAMDAGDPSLEGEPW